MNQILSFASLAGFITALIVHIAASMGINVSDDFPAVWTLHVGVFVVFVPFVLSSRKTLGPKPTFAEIRASFPMWVVGLGICIVAYAFVNFMVFMLDAKSGSPSIVDGKFMLMEHGTAVRELTALEYSKFKADELRGFSGHWMVFYFVPFAYFMFRKQR